MDAFEFFKSESTQQGITLISDGMDLASACHGKVIVDQAQLDLFASALHAAVSAGKADPSLYDQFTEFVGGNAGRFIGA